MGLRLDRGVPGEGGENSGDKPIRLMSARQSSHVAPTGVRRRSPAPPRRRLDPPGPQLEHRIDMLGFLGSFGGPRSASRLYGSSGVTWAWERDFYLEV